MLTTPQRLQILQRHNPQAFPLAVVSHSLGEVLPRPSQRRPPSARNEQAQVGLQARSLAKTFDDQERTRQLIVPGARRAFLRPKLRPSSEIQRRTESLLAFPIATRRLAAVDFRTAASLVPAAACRGAVGLGLDRHQDPVALQVQIDFETVLAPGDGVRRLGHSFEWRRVNAQSPEVRNEAVVALRWNRGAPQRPNGGPVSERHPGMGERIERGPHQRRFGVPALHVALHFFGEIGENRFPFAAQNPFGRKRLWVPAPARWSAATHRAPRPVFRGSFVMASTAFVRSDIDRGESKATKYTRRPRARIASTSPRA